VGVVLSSERGTRSESWISAAALTVIASQVFALGWVVSSTWFKQDDFVILFESTSQGGFPDSMLTVHNGHLLPGIVGVFWVLRSLFGMQWWPFVAFIAVFQGVCSYLTWQVLKSFFGARPISVLLLVVYAASVLTVGANMWAISAVQYLPTQLAFPATILLLQRYGRRPNFQTAVFTAVPVLFAASFFVKAIAVAPFVAVLCALTPLLKSSSVTCIGRLRELRTPLILLSSVTIAYAIFYKVFTAVPASQYSLGAPEFVLKNLANIDVAPLTKVLGPSLFGGPGRFWNGWFSLAVPSDFEVWFSFVMIFLLFAWSMIRNWRSLKYWALLLAMASVNLALIALANRTLAELATRYMSDLVFPLVLLVGLAVVGNSHDERDSYSPVARKVIQRSASVALVAIVVAGVAVVAHSANSQSVLVADMKYAPGKSYVETARRSTDASNIAPTIIPQAGPVDVINYPFGFVGMSSTRVVLLPADLNVRFGSVTEKPFMVLSDGTVVPAQFDLISKAISPGTECLNDPDQITTTLKMDSSPIGWGWYGHMRYTASGASKADLVWSGPETVVSFESGSHDVYFPIEGGGETLTVSLDGRGVCLHEIEFLQLRVE
jgi:hypothetical protein